MSGIWFRSKSNNPNAKFLYGNILEDYSSTDMPVDCITCFITAVTIENSALLLERFISFKLKLIFINDFINLNGLDVVVGKRQDSSDFNYPYDIRSKDTWTQLFKGFPDYSIEFEPYVMKTDQIKSDNEIRNFHSSIDGEVLQRNEMGLILRLHNILKKINIS